MRLFDFKFFFLLVFTISIGSCDGVSFTSTRSGFTSIVLGAGLGSTEGSSDFIYMGSGKGVGEA
jgi:hypothetical protein